MFSFSPISPLWLGISGSVGSLGDRWILFAGAGVKSRQIPPTEMNVQWDAAMLCAIWCMHVEDGSCMRMTLSILDFSCSERRPSAFAVTGPHPSMSVFSPIHLTSNNSLDRLSEPHDVEVEGGCCRTGPSLHTTLRITGKGKPVLNVDGKERDGPRWPAAA